MNFDGNKHFVNLSIMVFYLQHTLETDSKERSFWKQRSGETFQICWSSDTVSFPIKNHCINFEHIYKRGYKKRWFIKRFYVKLFFTCSSWYEIKVVFMEVSNNPYFNDDFFWREVIFLSLPTQYLFHTRFTIPYQIVNIMEMIEIIGWFKKQVTYWNVWNK